MDEADDAVVVSRAEWEEMQRWRAAVTAQLAALTGDAAPTCGAGADGDGADGIEAHSNSATGVHGYSGIGTGVRGETSTFGSGVEGISKAPASITSAPAGVKGSSTTASGVAGISDAAPGVLAISGSSFGVEARSPRAQLYLNLATERGAPLTETGHRPGEVVRDSNGDLWACVADDSLRKVAGPASAGSLHLLPTPVRVYDSRPGTTPAQAPKTPLPSGNVARIIDCKHNASGVPAGATGVVLTVLLTNAAAGNGNLTVWAADLPKPLSNTMVWGGNAGRYTTMTMTAVDAQSRVKIDASLTTNVVLDVIGYYR